MDNTNINTILKKLNSSENIFIFLDNLDLDSLEILYKYANEKYRNEQPVISDAIYDIIEDIIRQKNPKSKLLKQIGAKVKSKNKVKLPYNLGSMDKIKPSSNKLDLWKKKFIKKDSTIVASEKLDGVSALLVYDSNNDVNLYTRGTSTEGTLITPLLKYLNLPSYEKVSKYCKKNKINGKKNLIALRGELIISKKTFDKNWKDTKKNARNTVSGLVNSKNINPNLATDTRLVLYEVVDPNLTILEQFNIIKELNFHCVHFKIIEDLQLEYLSKYLVKRKVKSHYDIDGIIITTNDLHKRNTSGNPDYAFAFKDVLEDQKATTTVVDIEWNKSKDGYIKPTVLIEPINIGGVTIKRVTGNNAKFIKDNFIDKGTVVEIIRSGDVIPKIEKIIKKSKTYSLPDGEWKWSESKVDIICSNLKCSDVQIKQIHFFFSKLDTKGLGLRIVEKLFESGLNTINKILKSTKEDILKVEGFKEKSAQNLITSVKKSITNIPIENLMVASNKLGHGMGLERVKSVLNNYPNIIKNCEKWSEDEFINKIKTINGWEEKTSKMFVKNFTKFIDFYEDIKKYVTIQKEKEKKSNGKYQDKKIVMSGFRDKDLQSYLESEGATITNTVTSNTYMLIVKDKTVSETGKVKKAKDLGVHIKTRDYFQNDF